MTDAGLMANDARDVRWLPLLILGVAHRFAIHRQAGVVARIRLVPLLAGLIQRGWIDTNQDVTKDGFTRHALDSLFATTAKALARSRFEIFRPIGDDPLLAQRQYRVYSVLCGTSAI